MRAAAGERREAERTQHACDVAIAGGGIVGCAAAVHLLRQDPTLDVIIIEPDPGYAQAATLRASGGVRQLFSRPENIALSQYTLDVIANWAHFAGPDAPSLLWRPNGYLFLATGPEAGVVRENFNIQLARGVRAEWLTPGELHARFPYLETTDLSGAVLSPDDGWLDPAAWLRGMLGAARNLGVRLRKDRVTRFSVQGTRVRTVELESGEKLAAGAVINAAGCWAAELAAQTGMPVPVEPMRRLEHYVETRTSLDDLPFIKDSAGLAIRPQGHGLSVGLVNFEHEGGFNFDIDHGYFTRAVWPALAHRVPQLDKLRLHSTSAGLYDQNRLDGNMIIGNWPGKLDNFYIACGFSGHGLMHAPGVGRALAELILHGEYRTLNLSRLSYQRIINHHPYSETGIR